MERKIKMRSWPEFDNFLNWIYIHRKPIAFTLVSIMFLTVLLDISIAQQNGVLHKAQNYQEYIEESEQLESIESHVNDINYHMDKFLAAISLEDYQEALEAITYVIENDTEDESTLADYYLKRGGTYVLMEKYDEALNDLNLSLQLNNEQKDIYTLKGQIYMLQENYIDALNSFEQATQLSENSPEVYYNMAVCYVMTNEYEKALEISEQLLQSDCDEALKNDCQLLIDAILNEEAGV